MLEYTTDVRACPVWGRTPKLPIGRESEFRVSEILGVLFKDCLQWTANMVQKTYVKPLGLLLHQ